MLTRTELLIKFINFEQPLEPILKKLDNFGWDSEEYLVTLTRQHLSKVLLAYIEGKINDADVEYWAESIECRDDIGEEKSNRDLVKDVIIELANPFLTEKLTKERAKLLYSSLVNAVGDKK